MKLELAVLCEDAAMYFSSTAIKVLYRRIARFFGTAKLDSPTPQDERDANLAACIFVGCALAWTIWSALH